MLSLRSGPPPVDDPNLPEPRAVRLFQVIFQEQGDLPGGKSVQVYMVLDRYPTRPRHRPMLPHPAKKPVRWR